MICNFCKQDMSLLETLTCSESVIVDFGDYIADPIRYGSESYHWNSERCHDCNICIGGIHHPGCDVEECPKCHGQLVSCGCIDN